MKLLLYVAAGLLAVGVAFLLIARNQIPADNPIVITAIIALFGVPPIGSFWMMYMSIRHEKNPLPMVLLAIFIPFTFVWYYFERVRPRAGSFGQREVKRWN